MSTGKRLAVLGAVIVIAIAALVIARGGGDKSTKSATATQITVKNAKPVGGIQQIRVKKGDPIRLAITSDTADEIHIHGYNLHKDVKAGGTVRFAFKATSDGNYEIELEGRKEQIAQLTVEP